MAGVSLVGFSGSLIKDTLRSTALSFVNMLDPKAPIDLLANETSENTEAAKVVVGICKALSIDHSFIDPALLSRCLFHPVCTDFVSRREFFPCLCV
jgi:hypothetical protein